MKKTVFVFLLSLFVSVNQAQTTFSDESGMYGKLLTDLKINLTGKGYTGTSLGGRNVSVFVPWIRDHIHTMKAHKYWAKDLSGYLGFMMARQSPKGMYYDYYKSYKNQGVGEMFFANVFDQQFFNIDVGNQYFMFRMPIEADLEYLMVEGAYTYWQTSGDTAFLRRWLPTLVKGMKYEMSDPLRWSSRNLLIKRPYSIDTWDFTSEPDGLGGVERLLYHIGNTPETPKGIMHGDNTGMFQACKQLALMYNALGMDEAAFEWNLQGDLFKARTNRLCWNGKYYSHFVPEEPVPAHIATDPVNSIGLSNTYSINRGAPTREMAASIIDSYKEIGEKTKNVSLVPWFGIYPFIEPDYGNYKVGEYMNGAILPLVGGELTKAAFQNGYETYAIEQLKQLDNIYTKNNRHLPGCLNGDGTPQKEAIPAVWGQAAFVSALVEGLAGVVDKSVKFSEVEISPRWLFADIDNVTVNVGYNEDGNQVKYQYSYVKDSKQVHLTAEGQFRKITVRIPFPSSANGATAVINGNKATVVTDVVNNSRYAVISGKERKSTFIISFK